MSVYGNTLCTDSRRCFARGPSGGCSLLIETYRRDGQCPFCKPRRDQTGDRIYPSTKTYEKPWIGAHNGNIMGLRGKKREINNESLHNNTDSLGGKYHRV